MQTWKVVAAAACVGILMACYGCDGDRPDLVVTGLTVTGPAATVGGSAEVPIEVVVRNQGSAQAGVFKVATKYTETGGTFVVMFTVPGQQDTWYPYTNAPLMAGQSVSFAGKVRFHPSVHGVTVSLRAIADSSAGDEFLPTYVRVNESDETNNESNPVTVSLP